LNDEEKSLFNILNSTMTKAGALLLREWLQAPLLDMHAIKLRHDFVELLVEDSGGRAKLRQLLKGALPENVCSIHQRLEKETASLLDLHKLQQFLSSLPELALEVKRLLENQPQLKTEHADPLLKVVASLRLLDQMLEQSLDLEFLPEVFVDANIDANLQKLKRKLRAARAHVDAAHAEAAHAFNPAAKKIQKTDKWPLKLETDSKRGFILRSPKTYDEKTINSFAYDFEVISYLKSGVFLTTGDLSRAAHVYQQIHHTYKEAQSKLIQQLVQTAATYVPVLQTSIHILAKIDVLASFAHVAIFAQGGNYIRPEINTNQTLEIIQGRHPCVEACLGSNYIANDYCLGQAQNFALVTGPNMGGKSTYIRALACIALMSQSGSFVPAQVAKLPIFDAILARVGASDNIHTGVSTFMAEMLEASAILSQATSRSLVIIDELGRGTSTADGFGLAYAITEKISRTCIGLFATHFHELAALEQEKAPVKNMHVSANVTNDNITFLYKLEQGPSDRSFGIPVAKLANFPDRVIQTALKKSHQLEESSHSPTKRSKLLSAT